MKPLKIFFLTGLLLLLVAIGVAGYVWLKVQQLTKTEPIPEINSGLDQKTVPSAPDFVESEDTPIANIVPQEGIKIDTTAVSEDQKTAAKKVGIDLDSVVITPEMVSCAEKKLGSTRVQEIMGGSSPSTLESISLFGCF